MGESEDEEITGCAKRGIHRPNPEPPERGPDGRWRIKTTCSRCPRIDVWVEGERGWEEQMAGERADRLTGIWLHKMCRAAKLLEAFK